MARLIYLLMKGAATYIPGVYRAFSRKRTGGTVSARYCYSVWLRHLVTAHRNGLDTKPATIAELGPGDSLGIGLCALLTGADRYYAFDLVDYATQPRNLEILEELIGLLSEKTEIPGDLEFPGVTPRLDNYSFPEEVLHDQRLADSLHGDRLRCIREAVRCASGSPSMVQYKVPWYDDATVEDESVDAIISQAVLEHVDELALTYSRLYQWLRPGGWMSHAIDFRCHSTAVEWNGHWAHSDLVWRIIRGRRPYLINRQPLSRHSDLLQTNGFRVVDEIKQTRADGLTCEKFQPRFRALSAADLETATAVVVSEKP